MFIRFLKSYILTRRFLSVLIVFAILFLAFGGNSYAATGDVSTGIDKTEIVGLVDLILKIIYIILWPLLVIAGLSLDNTLVYGSFLHMDAPLRAFRNIIKNFANFALGFLVLFAIVRKIFSFGEAGDKWAPQKIITQTLIAGVLIQISWFAMAALIDLSTVATYAVGALPLNVISSTDLGKHKIMNAHVEMDLSKFQKIVAGKNDYFKTWYSVPAKKGNETLTLKFSECKKEKGYIVGRMDGSTGFNNSSLFGNGVFPGTQNVCVKGGQLIFFNEFPDPLYGGDDSSYQSYLAFILDSGDYRNVREACNYVVRPGGKTKNLSGCSEGLTAAQEAIGTELGADYNPDDYRWLDQTNLNTTFNGMKDGDTRLQNNDLATSLDSIVDKSKGFVGPLITMYSSMLDFAQLASTSNDSSFGEISVEMLVKVGFAIGLFFPLVALAIVLIIRIGFLRAVIVGAPLLVLVKAFGREDKLGSLKDHFNLANVMQVIFAPVVTVFALSISLVFMSALMASIKMGGTTGLGITQVTTTEAGTQMFSFFKDCLELKLDGFEGLGGALDVFSWFLMNMVGIGLMRGIVFAAIKFNSIGKKIGGTVQNFGASFFQTLPILPVPGGEAVGLGSFGKIVGELPQRKADSYNRAGEAKVEKWINPPEVSELKSKEAKNIVTAMSTGKNITTEIEAITKKEGSEAVEIAKNSLPAFFTAVNELGGAQTETGKQIVTDIGNYVGNSNRYESAQLDVVIQGKDKIEEANKAIENPDEKLTAALTKLAKDKIKKSFIDKDNKTVEYTLTNTDGKFTFTPPTTTGTKPE